MIRIPRAPSVTLLLALSACGGGSPSGPTSQPSPSTVPGATVVATLYYDENQNGRVDGGEAIRIPDVEVSIGGGAGPPASEAAPPAGAGRPPRRAAPTPHPRTHLPLYPLRA